MIVIPTIDVEGMNGYHPFEELILGKVHDGTQWGAPLIAKILQDHGVSGTFFVDIYEHSFWGEEKLGKICADLASLGQDVQLHTHPGWRDDPHDLPQTRKLKKEQSFLGPDLDMMAKLSLAQQIEVLQHGVDFIEKWTGKRPTAHRAGGYSLNQDTLSALKTVGIPVDSSMNSAHKNSEVVWSVNKVVEKDGLLEIPVTVMDYLFKLPGLAKTYSKTLKTDLDICSLEELCYFVDEGQRRGAQVMNLFMHSYSLLNLDYRHRHVSPQPKDKVKLERFMQYCLDRPDVQVMSCDEFYQDWQAGKIEETQEDPVISLQSNRRIAHMGLKKIKHSLQDSALRLNDRRQAVMRSANS